MRTLSLPNPPSPDQFGGNALAWQRAAQQWMQQVKGVLQDANNEAQRPVGQQFAVPTGFTLNTVATGTTTGTDLSNVVCSLITALTNRGILSPTISRSQSQ